MSSELTSNCQCAVDRSPPRANRDQRNNSAEQRSRRPSSARGNPRIENRSQTEEHETLGPLQLAGAALVVFLAENARIPVDDPETHLELTMIHEVMVLDHSGPDLAFLLYGAALKLFLFGALVVRLALGFPFGSPWAQLGAFLGGMALFAVVVGVIESTSARLRLDRVPQFLIAASVLSGFALVLLLR